MRPRLSEDRSGAQRDAGSSSSCPRTRKALVAARQLANAVLQQNLDLPRRWLEDDEPRLAVDWLRASGALDARPALTPDELREFQAGIELLIEPYATRRTADAPDGAALVRILAYFMPEASPP